MKNKIFILGLAITMLASVAMVGFPAPAQAAGLTQQQTNAVMTLLQAFGADQSVIDDNVQSALTGGSSGGGESTAWCYTFNTDLTVGSSGNDVSALQNVLQKEGFLSTSGSDKGTFSEQEAAAVVKFQAKYGIRQTGYVGPLTRAKLNQLYRCGNNKPDDKDVSYTISTDKNSYTQDERIQITISAFNNSSEVKTLNFTTGCQTAYSIALYDSGLGQVCTQSLTSVTVLPNSTKTWSMTHDPASYRIPVGYYRLNGKVLGFGEVRTSVNIIDGTSPSPVQPSITVNYPTAGVNYTAGQTMRFINWSSSNFPPGTTIDSIALALVSTRNSSLVYPLTIVKNASYTSGFVGNFSLTGGSVNDQLIPATVPAGPYKLRVSCPSCGTNVMTESQVFNVITSAISPSITITAPTLNQNATAGGPLVVSWTSTSLSAGEPITIKAYGQDGNTTTLGYNLAGDAGVSNTGNYTVTLPSNMTPGQYKLQVQCKDCFTKLGTVTYADSQVFRVNSTAIAQPSISASPTFGTLSGASPTLWVDFAVNNYTPNGTELVDFGDGTKSVLGYTTAYNSRHDYHSSGTYTVKLLSGTTVIATTQVTVTASTATQPSITVNYPTVGVNYTAGQTIRFINWSSSNFPSGTTIDSIALALVSTGNSSLVYPLTIVKNVSFTSGFVGNFSLTGGSVNDQLIPATVPAGPYKLRVSCPSCGTNVMTESQVFNVITSAISPSITITAPTINQSATAGGPLVVSWTSTSLSAGEPITIKAYGQDGNTTTLGYNLAGDAGVPNTGNYTVTLPSNMTPGQYKLQVQCKDCFTKLGTVTYADSQMFRVNSTAIAQPSITVLSPNGGERYSTDQVVPFTYGIRSNKVGSLKYWLYDKTTDYMYDIGQVFGVDPSRINYTYTVNLNLPELRRMGAAIPTPSNNYLAFIEWRSDDNTELARDNSDGIFVITSGTPQPSITVNYPTVGVNYTAGQTIRFINWSSSNFPSGTTIDSIALALVSTRNSSLVYPLTIVKNASYTSGFVGNFSLTGGSVNDQLIPATVPAGPYKLRVSCPSCGTNVMTESQVFNVITSAISPSITITAPTINQSATAGGPLVVSWTSTSLSAGEPITIKAYGQDGNTTTLGYNLAGDAGVPNTGNYTVTLPSNMTPGQYKLQVQCKDCFTKLGTVTYADSQVFRVAQSSIQPSITVLSPNGGETLVKGVTTNIRWSGGTYPVQVGVVRATYPADSTVVGWIQVRANANGTLGWDTNNVGPLDYLTSGQSWSIAPGQYKILLVSPAANGNQCFGSAGCVYDVSDSYFTITAPTAASSINVSFPTTSGNLVAGINDLGSMTITASGGDATLSSISLEIIPQGVNVSDVKIVGLNDYVNSSGITVPSGGGTIVIPFDNSNNQTDRVIVSGQSRTYTVKGVVTTTLIPRNIPQSSNAAVSLKPKGIFGFPNVTDSLQQRYLIGFFSIPALPSITLSANQISASNAQFRLYNINWSATNANSCVLTTNAQKGTEDFDYWSGHVGPIQTSGSIANAQVYGGVTVTITCTGSGGTAAKSVTLTGNQETASLSPEIISVMTAFSQQNNLNTANVLRAVEQLMRAFR